MNLSTKLLIVLLVVLAVITYFFLPSENEREVSYKSPSISLRVDSASVIKLELKQPTGLIAIENVGGLWMITSPHQSAADPNAVAQLLGSISKFKVGSLISSNPEKQRLFQVDTTGTQLSITDRSGKIVSMIVGKMGPSFSEIYFRLPDSKEVYLGEGIDSWTINKSLKDWRDKSIIRVPSESIKEISITNGSKMYRFNHDTTGWKLADKSVEASEMNPMLNTLSNLRADDFVDTVSEIKSKPIIIGLKSMENISLNLYPMPPDSSRYFVQSSKSQQMYVISKWTAQQLFKPIEKPHLSATPTPKYVETPEKEKEIKPVITTPPAMKGIVKEPINKTKKPDIEKAQTPPSISRPSISTPTEAKKNQSVVPTKQPPSPLRTIPQTTEPQKQDADEEGDLIVHTVTKGEMMTAIAQKYRVTTEQIIKWNLLKTIAVKPGQELYIYVRK